MSDPKTTPAGRWDCDCGRECHTPGTLPECRAEWVAAHPAKPSRNVIPKTTDWPDPAKPGVPLNPERDGYHWLFNPDDDRPHPVIWVADLGAWAGVGDVWTPRIVTEMNLCYQGPVLKPDADALRAENARLREALSNIAANAAVPGDAEAVSARFVILPHQRIPITMRMRFAAEIISASGQVPKGASPMRQRRCFRMAMEKQKRRVLRLWRGTIK